MLFAVGLLFCLCCFSKIVVFVESLPFCDEDLAQMATLVIFDSTNPPSPTELPTKQDQFPPLFPHQSALNPSSPTVRPLIEAILQACNKSFIQKLAEVSVFLLDKGTFPTRIMEQITHLWETVKEDRRDKLTSIRPSFADKEKELDWLSAVITNSSLTGNEKRDFADFVMKRLTEQQRQIVEAAFDTTDKTIVREENTQRINNFNNLENTSASQSSRVQIPERQENISPGNRVEQEVLKAIRPFTAPLSILQNTLEPVGSIIKEANTNGLSPIMPQQVSRGGLPASVGNILSSNALSASSASENEKPSSSASSSSEKVLMSSSGKGAVASVAENLNENLLNGRNSILKDAMKVIQGSYNLPKGLAKLFDQSLLKPIETPPSLPYTFQHPLMPQQPQQQQQQSLLQNLQNQNLLQQISQISQISQFARPDQLNQVQLGQLGQLGQNLPNLQPSVDLASLASALKLNQDQINRNPSANMLNENLLNVNNNPISLREELPERIAPQGSNNAETERASELSPIVPQENNSKFGSESVVFPTYAPPPAIHPNSGGDIRPNPNTINYLPSRIKAIRL